MIYFDPTYVSDFINAKLNESDCDFEKDLDEEKYKFLSIIKANGDDLLTAAAKNGKEIVGDFLLKCGVNGKELLINTTKNGEEATVAFLIKCRVTHVNHTDKDNKSAVDYAWELKKFNIVFRLLQADSNFPKEFVLEVLSESEKDQKKLKRLVQNRDCLHKFIQEGCLEEIKVNLVPDNSKKHLNSENESAVYKAIKSKQFEIYAYLRSIGAEFKNKDEEKELDELTSPEQNSLQDFMLFYFPSVPDAHIYYLISKSRSQKPIEDLKGKVETFYKELDKVPECSIILKVLQYSSFLDIVFDFDEDNVKRICPTSGEKH